MENSPNPNILTACGNEPKLIRYRVDVNRREIVQESTSQTKGISSALV
jgi:hypothetical protein